MPSHSSASSQGLYSPDSHFSQAAYDATLAGNGSWGVSPNGFVETVNPQSASRKRSYDYANEFFEDVKRHKISPVYNDGTLPFTSHLTLGMAARLSALQAWVTDDLFKPTYNTYQIPQQQTIPSQHPYLLPALRTKQDLLAANQFLNQLQSHSFEPQYATDYLPEYPAYPSKTLYPTLDLDYPQTPMDMPSTGVYPVLFDQTPSMSSSNYVGMGSRMAYDQSKLVYAGTLQKAPPRSGSEELVDDMEKMDVDSESKEKKPEEKTEVQVKQEEKMKKKHLELVKKLKKLVEEMLLNQEKELEVKNESPVNGNSVAVAAH